MNNIPLQLLSYLITFLIPINLCAQDTTVVSTLSIPILSGFDDVEESSTGEVYINSTDLEFTFDEDTQEEQLIGLHFQSLPIPPGTEILSAYLQFWTDETSSTNCELDIYAEAVPNPSSFNTTNGNVSNRILTNTAVPWSPAPWNITNASTDSQKTPDLTELLQEVVNQTDWNTGNAINFIIDGTGRRVAHAYEGNPDYVATLEIESSISVLHQNLSNIYINELMAANNVFTDEYGEADDWVELYNPNNLPVLLSGLFLSDDAADKMKWQIESTIVIPANGFVVLWLDDAPDQGAQHGPFKLSSSGESLFLSQIQNGNLTVIDEVTFGELPQNISYGRLTDGANDWVNFGDYSPNESNNGNGLFLNTPVNFSIPSGYYSAGTNLTMSTAAADVTIHYTLDGSDPSLSSTIYTGPISLSQTTSIKAAAFKPGFDSGIANQAFYLVNGNHDLPVINLTIDPLYLWDNQEGMYVTGANGIPGYCSDQSRNWNQDWERPASIQYFEPDGTEAFQLNVGLKIGGGCSRGFAMKAFNVFLRGNEYGDDNVAYPLFKNLGIEEFKRFKLRASGNDFALTMLRDGAIQSLLSGQADIDLMAYEPAVVYINGQYWGCYGVREFFSKHYVAAHHGVNEDSLDLMKNPYYQEDIKEGDAIAWNDLTNYVSNNTLTNQNNYDYVADRIDIEEFMNYHIAQIYIANYDWPANNVAVWRHRNNGKWRWMLFDTDISSGYGQWSPSFADFNALFHATTQNGNEWPNGFKSTLFLRKLLQNTSFKEEFAQRTCTFGQLIFAPERTTHFIDSLSEKIASEIPRLVSKFNSAPAEWQLWNQNPVGGSASAWQSNLNTFKKFFTDRYPYVVTHYGNQFNYSTQFNLRFNFDETSGGTIVLHENEMKLPYRFMANYFSNVPLRVKAVAEPGYEFVRWEETGDTTEVIYFEANSAAVLTPVFSKDGEIVEPPDPGNGEEPPVVNPAFVFEVYPIPTETELTIEYAEVEYTSFNLQIFNALGQLIYEEKLTAKPMVQTLTVDVRNWANGVYFLKTKIGEVEKSIVLQKVI